MSAKSKIQWTDASWNPVVGCTKISPGCKNCYAKTLHDMRHQAHKAGKAVATQYAEPFEKVQLLGHRLTDPLHWRQPRKIFVNSVSDLFHKDVPDEFINRVFAVMALATQHTFQILTKRAERLPQYMNEVYRRGSIADAAVLSFSRYVWWNTVGHERRGNEIAGPDWPLPNAQLGVSVENRQELDRIDHLRKTPAAVRFLSLEPLLEDLGKIDLTGIHWVIVGGESGKGARPMHPDWARNIRDRCVATGVPFFFKQWGEWAPYTKQLADPLAASGKLFGENRFVKWTKDGWTSNLLDNSGEQVMLRVGKDKAGRLLDGREWNSFPTVPA